MNDFLLILCLINYPIGWVLVALVDWSPDKYIETERQINITKYLCVFTGFIGGMICSFYFHMLHKSKTYREYGYIIPTKANRSKKLLKILSE